MIDTLYQQGTNQALDDLQARPLIPRVSPSLSVWGLMGAPFRGVAAGGGETLAGFSESLTATQRADELQGVYYNPATHREEPIAGSDVAAGRRRLAEAVASGKLTGNNDFADSLRQRAAEVMPDPQTTHSSEQVVAGLFRFGGKAAGHMAALGPAGAVTLGVDEGLTEADRLRQQGVDIATRTEAGALTGVVAGGSMLIPMSGATRAIRFGKGVAVGEAANIGQSAAEQYILDRAGYHQIASTFDPFDPTNLLLGAVPGVLGAYLGHAPAKVGDLRKASAVTDALKLTPEEQAHEAAFEASAANLRVLQEEIARQQKAGNTDAVATLQAELAKQQAAHDALPRAQTFAPGSDEVAAARVLQTADALDSSRLTGANDLAGAEAHRRAVETAWDQIARGDPVDIRDIINDARSIPSLEEFAKANQIADEPLPPAIKSHFLAWVRDNGGISIAEKADITGDSHPLRSNPAGIFKKAGNASDELALRAAAEGYLRPDQAHDSGALADLVRRAVAGEQVHTLEQQMQHAQREQFLAQREERLQRAESRLKMLDVDTSAARGNLALLEAYEREHRPALLGAAMDRLHESQRAIETEIEAAAMRESAVQLAADAREAGRTIAEQVRESGASVSQAVARMAEQEFRRAESVSPTRSEEQSPHVATADQLAAMDPNMLVHMDHLDAPVRLGHLMEAVRAEAADMKREAPLLEAAAQCAITAL